MPPEGQRTSQVSKSPTDTIVVAATKINTAVIMGSIGQHNLEIMMDSGSSISLLAQAYVEQMINITEKPLPKILLRRASGIPLPIVKYVTASVLIQNMQRMLQQDFFVVSDLIVPAILGLDFLQQHGLVLDFSNNVVQVYPKEKQKDMEYQETRRIVEEARSSKPHIGLIAATNEDSNVIQKNVPSLTLQLPKSMICLKIVEITSGS